MPSTIEVQIKAEYLQVTSVLQAGTKRNVKRNSSPNNPNKCIKSASNQQDNKYYSMSRIKTSFNQTSFFKTSLKL